MADDWWSGAAAFFEEINDGGAATTEAAGRRRTQPAVDAAKVADALAADPPVPLPVRDYSGPLGALALQEEVRRLRDGDGAPGTS